ncbi:MAG: cupin domain-containing protein [Clostridia bacterium]|nr:cupin domain-containing protein [Clostridia bacterium]
MIYKNFKDTEVFTGKTNVTYEYNIDDKDLNYCIVKVKGRFPVEGLAINHKCKQMAHILKGKGILWCEGKEYKLKKNDVVLIGVDEKYYWKGNLTLGVPCSPAWYPEQHDTII